MQRIRLVPLIAGAFLGAAFAGTVPLAAQEQDVARGSYPYFQRTLTIAVNASVPGELQVVRSRSARVDIAALAAPGVASFAMGGWRGNELILTAAGAERAVFIVTVPERVHVSVRTPGANRSLGAFTPVERIEWGGPEEAMAPARPPLPAVTPGADGYYRVYGAGAVPTTVSIPSLASVEQIDVHMRGNSFRLGATRPLQVNSGDGDQLVIDLAGEPLDLLFEIPGGTTSFRVLANGELVLAIQDGKVARYCTPAMAQDLGDRGIRVTLTPLRGRLDCGVTTQQAVSLR